MNPNFNRDPARPPTVDGAARPMPDRGVRPRAADPGRRPVSAPGAHRIGAFHRPPPPGVGRARAPQPAARPPRRPAIGDRTALHEHRPEPGRTVRPGPPTPGRNRRANKFATAPPALAWLLAVGGAIGLIAALGGAAEEMGLIRSHTDRFSCGAGSGQPCPPGAVDVFGALNPLVGIVGFAVVSLLGALLTLGMPLPRQVWVGLQLAFTAGVLGTHWLVIRNLVTLEVLCPYCTLGCALLIPMFWYTTTHTLALGWLPAPASVHRRARALVRSRRVVLLVWYLALFGTIYVEGGWYARNPPADGALVAVALITVATLTGAGMARRFSDRMGLWLSLASAMMMVSAVTDIFPEVREQAGELGIPLWIPAIALAVGYLVITYFTRKGCAHGHDDEAANGHDDHDHDHPTQQEPGAATFGGVGTAAALTAHRVIEGSTLALTPSTAVIIALFVHSASEGLALAAMLHESRQRLAPWLVVSASGPAIGVIAATISPLPEVLVPILLAVVGGVLLRTAVVGLQMAVSKWRSGELRLVHIIASAGVATLLGAFLITQH